MPFLRGLFVERLIFGGAYLRRKICVSKSNGLPFHLEVNLPFCLCFTLYLRAVFSKYKPPGGLYLEEPFNGGFFALPVWGAYIWRGLLSEFYGIKKIYIRKSLQPGTDTLLTPRPLLPGQRTCWRSSHYVIYFQPS